MQRSTKSNTRRILRRTTQIVLGAALGLNLMTGIAGATPSTTSTTSPSQAKYECSDSHHSNTGHGANNDGGYQDTCDETDFGGNGQEHGPGKQTGKPCAGCVGNADDKNPPGQFPDGSDHNSGYECDGRDRPSDNQQGNGNHGIGDENPAHTGCTPAPSTPVLCPDGSAMPAIDLDDSGVIDVDDCDVIVDEEPEPDPTCPDGSPMTDTDGNGQVTPADCNKVDEEPEPDPTCPDGSPMTDTDGNGIINPADCNKVDEDETPADPTCPDGTPMADPADCDTTVDEEPEPDPTCPDGSPMTDTDGNGQVTPADCTKGTTTDSTPTTPEVTTSQVAEPAVPAAPAVLAVEVAAPEAAPAVLALTTLDVLPTEHPATPAGRPTQVLGESVERSSVELARTGLATDGLVLLAGAALIVGSLLLLLGRRRRPTAN